MVVQLRPYQQEAVSRALSDLQTSTRIGLVLPTGAGKTRIIAALCEALCGPENDSAALLLSHLSILTDQNLASLKDQLPGRTIGVYQGKRKPSPMAHVAISTMQTARSPKHIAAIKNQLVRTIRYVIVDEAHHLPTKSYEAIVEAFPDAKLIGCTATPIKNRMLMTNYFDRVSYSVSLQELIDQGYLVPPILNQIPCDKRDPIELMATVVNLYQALEAGKKAIVYMRSIEDAKLLRNVFESAGIRSRAVTSDITGTVRNEILSSFTRGETMVLTTVDVLTAGFDAPNVEAIFMPTGCASPTQYLQRVGRGLRPSDGKAACRVYMLGDPPSIATRLYERIERAALNVGATKPNFDTFREDLELTYAKPGCEVYAWTQRVVDVIDRMEKLGMTNFAELLNQKRFPRRFMVSVTDLLARLPPRKCTLPGGHKPPTDKQLHVLFEAGFARQTLETITKAEASMMISTIFNTANRETVPSTEFIVQDGQHKGKHISELPFAYRAIVKKRFPDSPIAHQLNAWESKKRSA